MEWHVNDLSLEGQFENSDAAKLALESILSLRARRTDLGSRLFCSRSLGDRRVTPTQTLKQLAQSHPDRNFRSALIRWVAGQGPFWSDNRAEVANNDDLFYFQTEDVTEQGLGEASRRRLLALPANSFSLESANGTFAADILAVRQGLPEEPLCTINIPNVYGPSALEPYSPAPVTSWQKMLDLASTKKHLLFSSTIAAVLSSKPFQSNLAERILQLLDILSAIADETEATGGLTEKGVEIYNLYFVGTQAWFSDESTSSLFWFADPSGGEDIYCSWHGKTKQGGQTRVHFEWPRPAGQRDIKVGYIGTKLTKS